MVARSPMALVGIMLFVSFCSCRSADTTWSKRLISPDQKHVAIGRSDVFGGFGTDAPQTTVDVNWTAGSQSPINVLTLPDAPGAADAQSLLDMQWITSTTLQLSYSGSEVPLFQAVKC